MEKLEFSKEFSFESMFKEMQNSIEQLEKDFKQLHDGFSIAHPKIISNYDKKNNLYFIEIELPNYKENEIDIDVKFIDDQQLLTVTAQKKEELKEQKKEKESFTSKQQMFQTTRILPSEIDIEKGEWSYKKGILRIEFPATNIEKIKCVKIKKK